VVLTVIAIALGGEPPKADDSAVNIARYLADKRDALLLSSAAWFIAAILLLWFFGTLRAHLSVGEDSDGLSATSHARGRDLRRGLPHRVVLRDQRGSVSNCGRRRRSVGSQRVLRFCRRVLCHVGHRVRGVFRAAALAGARTRLLPRWLCWFGAAAGAIQLLYTVNLIAAHGELANGGSLGLLEPLFSLIWFLSASIVLLVVEQPHRTIETR
jgi:hypothetical protein